LAGTIWWRSQHFSVPPLTLSHTLSLRPCRHHPRTRWTWKRFGSSLNTTSLSAFRSAAFASAKLGTCRSYLLFGETLMVCWLGHIKNLYNTLLLSRVSRYVQSINIYHYSDERLDNFRFPNLREVRFQGSIRAGMARFFENHPTLTRVKISMMREVNLKALVGLPNLKMVEIGLSRPYKSLHENQNLQTLCTRLEVLITPVRDMSHVPADLQCLHLKETHITNGFYWSEHQLEFLRRCPRVCSIGWFWHLV
jgi:hypothetical protein